METFAFDATPTEAQIKAAVRRASRPALLLYRGVGAVLVIAGGLALFGDGSGEPTAVGFLLAGVVLLVLIPILQVGRARRLTMARVGRPTSYRIDDVGIYTATDLSDATIRWPMVRAIDELPQVGVVLAKIGKAMFLPITVNGLAPEVRAALVTFLHAHAGAAKLPPPPPAAPASAPAASASAPAATAPAASAPAAPAPAASAPAAPAPAAPAAAVPAELFPSAPTVGEPAAIRPPAPQP